MITRRLALLPDFAPLLRVLLLTAPLVSGLLCAFLILRRSEWLTGALPSLAGLAGLGVIAAGSVALFLHLRPRLPSTGLLVLTLIATCAFGATELRGDARAPAGAGRSGTIRDPRHVILIVVDTLRADYLSCYSENAPPTPTLDALAGESLRFTQTRSSAPFTFASMCSILTGLAPTVHLGLHPTTALPSAVPTLAERMRDAGYLTGAIVRNPSLSPACRIDRGFEEYHFQREPRPPTALGEVVLRWLMPETYLPQVGAEVQTRRASEWIERYKDRDFFLWLQFFDPHMAYGPPREFLPDGYRPPRIGSRFGEAERVRGGFFVPDQEEREYIKSLYAAEVRYLDSQIGGIFETLKRLDLYENSLIVFTSDHGEEFWEHGGFEHGHAMYDETISVPFMIKLPGETSARGPIDEAVSNQSITPTVLELAGLPYDADDLSAPALVKKSGAGFVVDVRPRPLVTSAMLYFEDRTAVVFDGYKYVRYHITKAEELFDLRTDAGELVNLAAQDSPELRQGRQLFHEHLAQADELRKRYDIRGSEEAALDERTRSDLRSLGYVR
jgi:arylsulfatase A-like enzyme